MQLNYSELLENKKKQRVYNTSYNPGAIVTLPDPWGTVSQERYEELLASGALDSLREQQNTISEDEDQCDDSAAVDMFKDFSDVERAEAMAILTLEEYTDDELQQLLDNEAELIKIKDDIKHDLMDPCITNPVKTEDEATDITTMIFNIIANELDKLVGNNDKLPIDSDGGGSYTKIYIGIFVVLLLIGGGATYFFMQNPDFFSKNKNTNSTK